MSATIDLERLIVRQTYFIPIQKPNLKDAILQELTATYPTIAGRYPWGLSEEHKSSFVFLRSTEYLFFQGHLWGKNEKREEFSKLVREKSREFEKLGTKAFLTTLRGTVSDAPRHIHVRIVGIEENGCLCKVECLPTLYDKLEYLKDFSPTDFEIQSSYLTCKRFLETIFESGLNATLTSEDKKKLLKPTAQLLINDQASHQIFGKIEEILRQATGEVLLCGWIGTLLLPKLKEMKQKGVNIRVITHKANELKGKLGHQEVQRAFKELISFIGKDNISIRPECHCRVVVVDNKALIGSMDLNSASLQGSHRELAIYTEDSEIVRNLRKYFNGIFSPLSKKRIKGKGKRELS